MLWKSDTSEHCATRRWMPSALHWTHRILSRWRGCTILLKALSSLTDRQTLSGILNDGRRSTPEPVAFFCLTTQEILDIVDDHTERVGGLPMLYRDQAADLARAIEAKLKEKNAA